MKATIIHKIEKEIKDIQGYNPVYVEANYTNPTHLDDVVKDGEYLKQPITLESIYYEGVQVWNPLTKLKELYYVRTDDKKLFKDLLVVSQSFVDELLRKQGEKLLSEFDMNRVYSLKRQLEQIKKLPWYIRLFNRF